MVGMTLYKPSKRGRPRSTKEIEDKGTPELQQKRQAILNAFGIKGEFCALSGAVFDGCLLHRFFSQGLLSQQQLQTGLSIRRVYYGCLRSQGLKNRLSSSSLLWDGLRGNNFDGFESRKLEKHWPVIKSTIECIERNPFYNSLILKIILNDSLQCAGSYILRLRLRPRGLCDEDTALELNLSSFDEVCRYYI